MRPIFPEPSAREAKPSFSEIPSSIFEKISSVAKSPVISGETAYGGLSAAAGFIFHLEDGSKIFAKGNYPGEMAHGAENLRQEIKAYQKLPVLKNISPSYIGMVSEGDDDGWMLGLWEYVAVDDVFFSLEKMYERIDEFQSADGTAKILTSMRDKNYLSLFIRDDKKWRRLRDDTKVREKFLSLFEDGRYASEWLSRNLAKLCELQAAVPGFSFQEGLVHGDLRRDNFLASEKSLYVIDWPNACHGPLAFDLAFLFSSLEAQGLGRMPEFFSGMAPFSDEEKILMASAIAGFFADQIYRDVPGKLPRLRWMQKGMFVAQMRYLASLGVVESIPVMSGQGL